MSGLTKTPVKTTAVQTPLADGSNTTTVLRQLKEIAEVGQRLRGDPGQSFVRVNELVALGLVTDVNGVLQPGPGFGSGGSSTIVPSSGSSGVAPFQRGASWSGGGASQLLVNNVTDVPVFIPMGCTIKDVTVLTEGGPGSCSVDIWSLPIGSFPPTSANSIVGGNYPAITSGKSFHDTAMTGWNLNVSAGACLVFHLRSVSLFTEVSVFLTLQPTGTSPLASNYTDAQAVAAVAAALANTGNVDFSFIGGAISAIMAGTSGSTGFAFSSGSGQFSLTLPNGIIIKWGSYTKAQASSSPTTTNFTTAFPTNCFWAAPVSQTGNANNGYIERAQSFGLNSLTTTIDAFGAGSNPSTTVYWLAIGN